ncbi:2-dehydropantoate 2-reductase [Immersiella caudata]|uniref:2-dehydropantoate 2-reductase n=1 Tax=Immersiella caudata TaxID=314043 RepID=A0AA39WS61_9PEZI|nr:2-dehydropantoate 2-reductase [Immersiella caudata]
MTPRHSDAPIHILGVGNLGKYVAHALAKSSPKPVTLIFHRKSLEDEWRAEAEAITCITDGVSDSRSRFQIETLPAEPQDPEPIKHLIVTTKAYMTVGALGPLKRRLDSSSTVLFLQNGMGAVDEVRKSLFPTEKDKPTFLSGICSAGVYSTKPFTIVHAGTGTLLVGPADDSAALRSATQPELANEMLQRLSEASVLETAIVSANAIKEAQLKKLVVNAVINPLTAILRCQNGKLLDRPAVFAAATLVIEETSTILRAMMPHLKTALSDQTLLELFVSVAEKTGKNTSSMLQDAKAGRRTEIDYINGYFYSEAVRLGVPHRRNQLLAELVAMNAVLEAEDLLGRLTTDS